MTEQDNNTNQNTYQRPTHILLAEMKELHQAMHDLCVQFSALAERMEECAEKINTVDDTVSRKLFRDYMDAGIRVGRYIIFTDAQDAGAVYQVIDIDSQGFWIRQAPDGAEYHLKLLPNRDRLPKIRSYPPDSNYIRRRVDKNHDRDEFRREMANAELNNEAMAVLDAKPDADGNSENGQDDVPYDDDINPLAEAEIASGMGEDIGFRHTWNPRRNRGRM